MGNFFLAILYKPLKFRDLNILESATQLIKENLCFCKTYLNHCKVVVFLQYELNHSKHHLTKTQFQLWFLLYIHPRLHCLHQQETSKNLLSIPFSAFSENKPKNTLQVIWPRKWLYRELFTAFFQHWVNLISLSKSPFFGLLKRSNKCLICAGGPLGDLYATAIHSSANRDFLYMESGSISGPCINLA